MKPQCFFQGTPLFLTLIIHDIYFINQIRWLQRYSRPKVILTTAVALLYIATKSRFHYGYVNRFSNIFEQSEKEVAVNLKPVDFTEKASIKLTAQQARGILKEMGYDLPSRIKSKGQIDELLKSFQKIK